jgi:hypothetical protein
VTGFVPAEVKVWRVVTGQPPTVYQSGFTTIIDITFGSDGSLYVLEFGPRDLWRVPAIGPRELVASGFVTPGSVTIGSDGAFYVSNCSILFDARTGTASAYRRRPGGTDSRLAR